MARDREDCEDQRQERGHDEERRQRAPALVLAPRNRGRAVAGEAPEGRRRARIWLSSKARPPVAAASASRISRPDGSGR